MPALHKAIILLLISLSPASAGAFSSPALLNVRTHQVGDINQHHLVHPKRSLGASSAVMNSRNSPDFSLPLFLRGGQQDDYTASSEEIDLDDSTQKQYGTQSDEESTASVEMTKQAFEVGESSVSETVPSKRLSLSAAAVVAPLSSALQTAATFYTQQLSARPILTKSATAAIVFGLSDWVAQLIERKGDEEKKEPVAFTRILSAFLVGLLFFGPAANLWYDMIFKVLPSTSLLSTLQKAALGQIFFGPTFTCVFFGAGMIESGSFSLGGWIEKIKNDLPGVWASGLGYWPLVDFISYKVVPVQWIPLFVNFASFVWTIYLSLVANRGKDLE
jgi:protein Mpv17